jgi:hypothetical protein
LARFELVIEATAASAAADAAALTPTVIRLTILTVGFFAVPDMTDLSTSTGTDTDTTDWLDWFDWFD